MTDYDLFADLYSIEIPRIYLEHTSIPIAVEDIARSEGEIAFIDTVSKAIRICTSTMDCKPFLDDCGMLTWRYDGAFAAITYRCESRKDDHASPHVVERFELSLLPEEDQDAGEEGWPKLLKVFDLEVEDNNIPNATIRAFIPKHAWINNLACLSSMLELEQFHYIARKIDGVALTRIGDIEGDDAVDAYPELKPINAEKLFLAFESMGESINACKAELNKIIERSSEDLIALQESW